MILVACAAKSFAQVAPEDVPEEGILGKAGEAVFSADELRKILSLTDPASRKKLADNPSALNESVRSLLLERLVLGEASKKGWDKNESVVALIEKARDQVIMETYLAAVTALPEGSPSEDQIRSVYEANKSELTTPSRFRLARISIGRPGPESDASLPAAAAKVEQVLNALNNGADFGAVAREMSEEPQSAKNGGEIGWFRASQLNPEIRNEVASLSPGGRTGVIELEDGWHIVKLLEKNEPRPLDYEEVKPALAEQIRSQLITERRRLYLARLLEDNPIAVNEVGMASVIEQSGNLGDGTDRGNGSPQAIPDLPDQEASQSKLSPFRFRASAPKE